MTPTPDEVRQTAAALMALADDPNRDDIQYAGIGQETWMPIRLGNDLLGISLYTVKLRIRPKPKLVPFTQETFPRGAHVRISGQSDYCCIQELRSDRFLFGDGRECSYEYAVKSLEISTDNCRTFHACGIEVEDE